MISAAILECEAEWINLKANRNHIRILENLPKPASKEEIRQIDIKKYKDDWHRFLVHKLVYGCGGSDDLMRNNVNFITFNYDTSLEYQLFQSLSAIDLVKADAERFLENRVESMSTDRSILASRRILILLISM